MMLDLPSSLAQAFSQMSTEASPFLERARECARQTLPHLIPPEGGGRGQRARTGFSNFGARCVNSLSAKLLMALLGAGRQSFFKYEVPDHILDQLNAAQMRSQVDEAMARYEKAIQHDIETTPVRTPVGEAIKHLLVAGNVLLFQTNAGAVKLYPLGQYVVSRDGEGNVLCTVSVDNLSPATLPEDIREEVIAKLKAERRTNEKTVKVYTGVYRRANDWRVWQEVEGKTIPSSKGTYPLEANPWLPLRGIPRPGESYGGSIVEDYLGYLTTLEGLTAAATKGIAAAAKVVYLRRSNSTVRADRLAKSQTGDVIDGNADDVTVLQTEKSRDFNDCRALIADLKEELAYAFALNQAVQRQAERVTAEEIRFMAQELDATLGGLYSSLSQEFQLPFLQRRQHQMTKTGKLPRLPVKALKPVILTGLDALGRGAELDNLSVLTSKVVDLGGVQALERHMHFTDLIRRFTTALGIKPEGLVKTEDEVASYDQQQQQQLMIEKLGPNAVTQMGNMAQSQMAPQGA